MKYRNFKNLFEKVRKKSKQNYYQKLLEKNSADTKKTWDIIKEIIGKNKPKCLIPKSIQNNNKTIYNQKHIAKVFNEFFVNIGAKLAFKIPKCDTELFRSYLRLFNKIMSNTELTKKEIIDAFNTLKSNKSPGDDDINVNVVKYVFDLIESPLQYIFNLSITTGVFPQQLKHVQITPVLYLSLEIRQMFLFFLLFQKY